LLSDEDFPLQLTANKIIIKNLTKIFIGL